MNHNSLLFIAILTLTLSNLATASSCDTVKSAVLAETALVLDLDKGDIAVDVPLIEQDFESDGLYVVEVLINLEEKLNFKIDDSPIAEQIVYFEEESFTPKLTVKDLQELVYNSCIVRSSPRRN